MPFTQSHGPIRRFIARIRAWLGYNNPPQHVKLDAMSQRDVHLHLHLYLGEDDRVGEVLTVVNSITTQLGNIQQEENIMSAELDALTASVAADATVEESAITLIQGLSAQITAAVNDPAALSALAASLDSESAKLAAAVTAGTPVVPVPPVTPAQ